ncbi:hypothetical protein ACWG0P_05755 [Amedibacillus sp. YH-ame6]
MGSNSKETRYDEYLAKLELEYFFPDLFKNLEIKDKPDLIGDDVGVEVTIAINHKNLEMDSLYSKIGTNKLKSEKKAIKKIEEYGGVLKGGILSHPVMNDDFINISNSFRGKLEKLNSGDYHILDNMYIFISDWIFADKKMLNLGLEEAMRIQNKYETHFKALIVRVPSYLYFMDLNKGTYRIIKYNSEIQCKLSNEAAKQCN